MTLITCAIPLPIYGKTWKYDEDIFGGLCNAIQLVRGLYTLSFIERSPHRLMNYVMQILTQFFNYQMYGVATL